MKVLRHVPLAALLQGYISVASRRKGRADVFCSASVRWSDSIRSGSRLMPRRERAERARIGGADHALRRNRDRVGGGTRRALRHLVAARLEAADYLGRQAALERDLVGQPLVVNAMGRDRLVDRKLEI